MATLYLIPTPISKQAPAELFPLLNAKLIEGVRHFLVETIQQGVRFLEWMEHPVPTYEIEFAELNKYTKPEEIHELMAPMRGGYDMGVMSDAGCPGVADPGSLAVSWAHANGHRVKPLIGPSSLLLALMASGLNGQNFQFHGYLPRNTDERKQRIKQLEEISSRDNTTQLFIEAPQRNLDVLKTLNETLHQESKLCIAANLSSDNEHISTRSVGEWRTLVLPAIEKIPVIFLFQGVPVLPLHKKNKRKTR